MGRKAQPKTVIVAGAVHTIMVKQVSMAGTAKALELLCRHQGFCSTTSSKSATAA